MIPKVIIVLLIRIIVKVVNGIICLNYAFLMWYTSHGCRNNASITYKRLDESIMKQVN